MIATDVPRCHHCGSVLFVVTDGPQPPVCCRCVRILTTVAANPYAIDPAGRQALLDRSLDVVDIRDGRWVWTSLWPGPGELRLIHGGRA